MSMFETEDEAEMHQNQRLLALETIDELTSLKLELIDSGLEVPKYISYAIAYLKKEYLTQERTISEMMRKES